MNGNTAVRQSNVPRQNTIVICGDLLPHRKLFTSSVLGAAKLTLIRVPEDGALTLCKQIEPSVLVARQTVISQIPGNDFVDLANYGKGTRVIAVLDNESPEAALKALRMGCRGVLPGPVSPKLLKQAVFTVLRGELWAPGQVIATLVSDLLSIGRKTTEKDLTPREQCIHDLILKGYKNSLIAETLFISPETVRWHTRRIYRKVGKPVRIPQEPAASWPSSRAV
jgi:DNA-binding NarL/FixJ family response regulator